MSYNALTLLIKRDIKQVKLQRRTAVQSSRGGWHMAKNGSNGAVRTVADHIEVMPSAVKRDGRSLVVVSAGNNVMHRVPVWEIKSHARTQGRNLVLTRIPHLDRLGFSSGGMPNLA